MTSDRTLKRANPNTIQDKVLVGYQGWFTCVGDGPPIHPGHHGWLHWFNSPIPNGGRPNVDLWPDTSEYDQDELYPAPGLATASGDPVHLFSSRNPKTVQRHFHWMARHGVDGAFLQRFAGQCEIKSGNLGIRDLRDEVGDRVREAAEAEGRVFAIMYDVSGVSPDKIQDILQQDWTHLLRDKHVVDSPNYLREHGRPVVALWGFGFNGRNHTPQLVRAIAGFFRSVTPGGVYLIAGAPGHWRTSSSDADRNPEFLQVWTDCFDAISPWTVGRYGNEEEANQWGQGRLKADADYLNKIASDGGRKVDYMPVVLPGGSGFNLSKGKWHMNDVRRLGGRFLWTQIYNAHRAGVRTIYGAMWDEYDEGTAFMPIVPHASQVPVHPSFRFLALDVDGHDLPSDWYMRVLGYAAEGFHGERTLTDTFPIQELQDYWSTRPRYEDVAGPGPPNRQKQPDIDGATRAFEAWEVSGNNLNEAPPPYTLEDTLPIGGAHTHAPPVHQDTRPSVSPSLVATAAAGTAALGVAAYAMSSSSHSSSAAPPPHVNMSSRPVPPGLSLPGTSSSAPVTEPPLVDSPNAPMPEPLLSGMNSPNAPVPQPPPSLGSPPSTMRAGYDPKRHQAFPQPHEHGQFPSIGHGGGTYHPPPGPSLPGVPPPMGAEDGRGRRPGRSRSRSRSRSSSRSRGHTSHPALHGHSHSVGPGYGHGYELGPHPGPGTHRHQSYSGVSPQGHGHHGQGPHGPHGHGHSHSLSPVGSPPGITFPGPVPGMHNAYHPGGGPPSGGYTPVHSHPIGYGGPPGPPSGYGQSQPPYTQGPWQGGYTGGPPQGGYGYGPGPGYGQGQMGQPGYRPGYTPHPSSGYHPSYPAGPGPAGGGGGGGGVIQGGIASALHVVEGIAGPQTRRQLEKTVKSLSNTGSSLLNKLK